MLGKDFIIGDLQPAFNISFSNGEKEVGRIDFSTGKMVFSGDMEESARVFFDYLKESLIDPYLESKKKNDEFATILLHG